MSFRGSQKLVHKIQNIHIGGLVAITDAPVYMCERGAWGRRGCGLASANRHTQSTNVNRARTPVSMQSSRNCCRRCSGISDALFLLLKIAESLHFATACTSRSSSVLSTMQHACQIQKMQPTQLRDRPFGGATGTPVVSLAKQDKE